MKSSAHEALNKLVVYTTAPSEATYTPSEAVEVAPYRACTPVQHHGSCASSPWNGSRTRGESARNATAKVHGDRSVTVESPYNAGEGTYL